jgi:nucleotide-binding universal stress UspA family protein
MAAAISTILTGTDGSPASEAALHWAGGLALDCHADVHAVYAWWPDQSELAPPIAGREERQAEAKLKEWCRPLRRAGVSHKAEAVEGEPAEVLREEAQRIDADLVVIGRRRPHGPLAAGLGAVTHQLVHGLQMPVAVVPPSTETFPGGPVIVGVEGSDANLVTVLWAAGLATALGLGRSLLAVQALDRADTFGLGGWRDPDVGRVEAHLKLVRQLYGPIPLEIVPDIPGSALDDVARRRDAAAVVVGGLGRGVIPDLRLGRTAVQLLQRGSGAVVIVPDRW